MLILPLAFIALILYNIKYVKNFVEQTDYLSVKSTNSIKGICALGVILQHLTLKLENQGIMFLFGYIGFLFVSLFFFFSAYGLTKSMLNKPDYFKHFWSRRLKKVYLPMVLINILYIIWYYFIAKEYTPNCWKMIKGVLGIELVVGTEWYIITLFVFYALFYILFKPLKVHNALPFFVVGTIIYAYICNKLQMDIKWYKSCFAFPLGLVFGIYESRILAYWKSHYKACSVLSVSTLLALIILFCGAFKYGIGIYSFQMILLQVCISILFVISYLIISMKVVIDNRLLRYGGGVSYELYLIHYLFIEICRSSLLYIKNDFEYFAIVITCSLVFSAVLKNTLYYLHFILKIEKTFSK